MLQQHRDLLIPGTAAEWVAMDQDDRPSRAVVFVVQVDRARVLLADIDVRHSFLLGCGALQIGRVTGKPLRLPNVSVKEQDVEGSCPSTSEPSAQIDGPAQWSAPRTGGGSPARRT